MTGDQKLAENVRRILAIRAHRKTLFPNDLFDEFGWNMLLHLFLAHASNRSMAEARLIELAEPAPETGRRWIAHLVADGQVEVDGGEVALTSDAVDRLRQFLRAIDTQLA